MADFDNVQHSYILVHDNDASAEIRYYFQLQQSDCKNTTIFDSDIGDITVFDCLSIGTLLQSLTTYVITGFWNMYLKLSLI